MPKNHANLVSRGATAVTTGAIAIAARTGARIATATAGAATAATIAAAGPESVRRASKHAISNSLVVPGSPAAAVSASSPT